MLYAQVVMGIAVEGPFDYSVPDFLQASVRAGSRVEVFLRGMRMTGYVVGLSQTTDIANVRAVVRLIDRTPLLDADMLALTRQVSLYYCASWGSVIEAAIPERLRRGAVRDGESPVPAAVPRSEEARVTLVHDLEPDTRWQAYAEKIGQVLSGGGSAAVVVPDEESLAKAEDFLRARFPGTLGVLHRKSPDEAQVWEDLKAGRLRLALGMRSAVFAPLANPGVLIVDDEQNEAYKQDQAPHYHARDVALMRGRLQKIDVILGSIFPSVESFYLASKKKALYRRIERTRPYPEIKIINTLSEYQSRQKKAVIARLLEDAISAELAAGGKILLFLNRTGFATWAACHTCGAQLRCPRCSSNLVFHYSGDVLRCHLCRFTMQPPKICPQCSSGYIKYSGAGTEKIESDIARAFPSARIQRLDGVRPFDPDAADICIATRAIIKHPGARFGLIGVIGLDNALNRVDLRAAEKACGLLAGLLALTEKKFYIQTRIARHPCFDALLANDISAFYGEELKSRKQLLFPPYRHLVHLKLRGSVEEKVKAAAEALFERMSAAARAAVEVISVNPGQPSKLRGKFHWQILISAADAGKAGAFIKTHLKGYRHSGVIVTVDVDPV